METPLSFQRRAEARATPTLSCAMGTEIGLICGTGSTLPEPTGLPMENGWRSVATPALRSPHPMGNSGGCWSQG